MFRYTNAFMVSRAATVSSYIGRTVTYTHSGYGYHYTIDADRNKGISPVDMYGKTKRELVETSQAFMHGFWHANEVKGAK